MSDGRRIVLLGPQRFHPTVRDVLAELPEHRPGRPVAVITAGWEEREDEYRPFQDHIDGPVVNLSIFARCEDVYRHDPDLRGGVRARHERMRALQDLYRQRLGITLSAARRLCRATGDEALLGPERDDAIEAVRRLDEHHARRLAEGHDEFLARWRPHEREHVVRHRREIAAALDPCGVVCIAGGHVGILLNRMRVLDPLSLCGDRPIVAWSAGAMALTDRVVLFHDFPPQGRGDAEIFEPGFGLAPRLVALPHADTRLALDDRVRVTLLARRFAPALCAALTEGSRFDFDGHGWRAVGHGRRLTVDGVLEEVAA